jgi:hypothetical protein
VILKIVVRSKSLIAHFAPNTAQVLRYVPRERLLVGQNFVTHAASCAAQVDLEVCIAAPSRAVRLTAHATNKPPITFDNLIGRQFIPSSPSWYGRGQVVACKFQLGFVKKKV